MYCKRLGAHTKPRDRPAPHTAAYTSPLLPALGETNIYPINIELNDKQIDLIEDIVSCTDSYVLVYKNPKTNNIQVFFSFHNGTNGLEGNIINSMRECLELIENINKHPDIEWVTVLDTYFDTCDDVYSWLFTFVAQTKE